MSIKKTGVARLKLTHFRSYQNLDLGLDTSLCPVVLTGPNGIGKTNVLEAVSFLAPGRGLRSARLMDVAHQDGAGDKTWSVVSSLTCGDFETQVGTGITLDSDRRQVKIDGKSTSKQAALGEVARILWLTPAQDRLFSGEPVARRRFLDRLVQAFDPEHAGRLSSYGAALKEWTCLLKEGRFDEAWLSALERQIVASGVSLVASRQEVVDRITPYLQKEKGLDFPVAELKLTGMLEEKLWQESAVWVEEFFADYLRRSRSACARGQNVAGAHTSDFSVVYQQKGREASLASSGEQKALLISLILAEVSALVAEQGIGPILLLDEVTAHLDDRRRTDLMGRLKDLPAQVWMTGSDPEHFKALGANKCLYDVEQFYLKKVA